MFENKFRVAAAVAALTLAGTYAIAADVDYTAMTPQELAEYLIFEANGFKLDAQVQEESSARDRLVQDELQMVCTETRNNPSTEQAEAIRQAARDTIVYPEGDIVLGDWEKGRDLAWSGFGYRLEPNFDNHERSGPGANCYNCHEFAGDRQGGTIGPSLRNYGKLRASEEEEVSQAIYRLAYGIIYNAHSMFPCTRMPRQGAKGLLTQEQILDIMAYLFDPESPVNNE
ncbi:sulfur oxidation c-type cytochrome SoxX [Thiocapsa imhoffii]|uniref:Sulfur oxidation c-type cytochrome SoxX n=1 Tax=Thiocapsa imhoffii TaxID=382777 RepID=A0A9X0WIM8_9GAMM|nr:sulfur oxidation c-type cytochrome SoxX [Thiocapsa imhoffii]MBK1644797.1 sulfur oxidation c-type cytochrome SoxX [Thiocapsa imhoffii]